MNGEVWPMLAKRINQLLSKEGYDGMAIIRGTDIMEETAYFLNLTVCSKKPVVMVGAMRPTTDMSADGPLNLYNAIVVVVDKSAMAHEVIACMNDIILDAKGVIKTNTTAVETLQGANYSKLAYIHNDKVFFNRMPENEHTYQSVFNVDNLEELPRVGIMCGYSNVPGLSVKAFMDAKSNGIVHAGVGNDNLYHTIFDLVIKAREQSALFVCSPRVPTGATTFDAEVDDVKYQFVASQTLNP